MSHSAPPLPVREPTLAVTPTSIDRSRALSKLDAAALRTLESTGLPIIMLNSSMQVVAFTSAAAELFGLDNRQIGLRIDTLLLDFQYDTVLGDCRAAMQSLGQRERLIQSHWSGKTLKVAALPRNSSSGQTEGVTLTFTDFSDVARVQQALLESQASHHLNARAACSCLFTTTADLGWDYVNPLFYEITGRSKESVLGQGWFACVHPDDVSRTMSAWTRSADSGEVFEEEFRIQTAHGTWRWFRGRASPYHNPDGSITRWYGSCTDVHDRRRAEERQQELLNELQHRVKNILAVVRSVLTRTLETTSDLEDFGAHFTGRFAVISRTQGVLSRTADGLIDLEELVREEFCAQGFGQSPQVTIEGPTVQFSGRTAQTLGLAIHELTTNALKFGALGIEAGHTTVRWRVMPGAEGDRLVLEWRESGVEMLHHGEIGPDGFGRELIEHGLAYELDAMCRFALEPDGLSCSIEMPLVAAGSSIKFEKQPHDR